MSESQLLIYKKDMVVEVCKLSEILHCVVVSSCSCNRMSETESFIKNRILFSHHLEVGIPRSRC
jgi:hypothetical protein